MHYYLKQCVETKIKFLQNTEVVFPVPKHIPKFMIYLLMEKGYSIFIVTGRLPECEADDLLNLAPAVQLIKPRLINENQSISKSEAKTDDPELQRALMASRCEDEKDDKMLQRALQMSLEGTYTIRNVTGDILMICTVVVCSVCCSGLINVQW